MTTVANIREAIKTCAATASTEHPFDTDGRLNSFVARLSGMMERLGETELDAVLYSLCETVLPPAHSAAARG